MLRVVICKDPDEVGYRASAQIVELMRRTLALADRFVLGLPTGETPLPLYGYLIAALYEGEIDFARVHTVNLDEYVGLPPNHPQSYRYFMMHNLFRFINIPLQQTHMPNGLARDTERECGRYQRLIESMGVDLWVLGIGRNEHIAFNEPGSSLASRTRIKTLNEDTIIENSRFFDNDVDQVPKTALTVGVATVMDARTVMIIVSGHNKARALQEAVEHGLNHMWTVSCLQLHPHGLIVCDEAATVEMKVGTVNYFRDIEKVNLDPKKLLKG